MKWGNVIDSSLLLSHFFSLPCFLFISPFLLFLPCLAACFVVYVLAVLFCWFLRVNGKRNCLCWVFWFNKKKEEALYVFGDAFFGFLWEVCLTAIGSCWWSQPSWICGKGGNFLYFWARKRVLFVEFWRAGTVVLFVFVMLLFFLNFLSHLSVLNCA